MAGVASIVLPRLIPRSRDGTAENLLPPPAFRECRHRRLTLRALVARSIVRINWKQWRAPTSGCLAMGPGTLCGGTGAGLKPLDFGVLANGRALEYLSSRTSGLSPSP